MNLDKESIIGMIMTDVRIKESLQACMNCGVCTAVCPASEFYEYDPRTIAIAVQSKNTDTILELLESDYIWYCGQCMSCKPRCPRNNCPGVIISVLRKASQMSGVFVKSKMGRQQYLISNSIGTNIFEYGYCIHPTSVVPETHPEQGPVWDWAYQNMGRVYQKVGANLDGEGPGAMRRVAQEDRQELIRIFEETNGMELRRRIDYFSSLKAIEWGFTNTSGEADMKRYTEFLLNNEEL